MEERKLFVCKFCNKRYPCGKSLGGHIRTHMTQHSSTDTVKFDDNSNNNNNTDDAAKKKRKKSDLGSEYGLRENPRKTSRFVHPNPTFVHHDEKFCKECGKGFPSLKALCGHMACHSEKGKQKLVMMDAQPDVETCVPKGSKRLRFMALNSHNNLTSSSVSEVEQEEEEEVAMCLMLLSKDFSGQRGRFALITESNSENNSVVLEAKSKSPSVDTRIAVNSGKNKIKNSVCNIASQHVEKKEARNDDMMMKFKFSDSGYFRYGSKKVDSGVSMDGILKNDVFNRTKVGDRYGFEDYSVSESRKKKMNNRVCRSRNTEESKKSVLKKLDYSKFDSRHDYPSRKNKKNGFPSHEIYKNGSYDTESYGSDEKSTESTDSDSDTDSDSYPSSSSSSQKHESKAKKKLSSNKRRDHECPICNKIFRSGQALGGHKRSHFVGGFEENNTLIIKQDPHNFPSPSPSPSPSPAVPCLIDLNLPAPID